MVQWSRDESSRDGGPPPLPAAVTLRRARDPSRLSAMSAALSTGAVIAIAVNSILALLILILLVIMYRACRQPSTAEEKTPIAESRQMQSEVKYLLKP